MEQWFFLFWDLLRHLQPTVGLNVLQGSSSGVQSCDISIPLAFAAQK